MRLHGASATCTAEFSAEAPQCCTLVQAFVPECPFSQQRAQIWLTAHWCMPLSTGCGQEAGGSTAGSADSTGLHPATALPQTHASELCRPGVFLLSASLLAALYQVAACRFARASAIAVLVARANSSRLSRISRWSTGQFTKALSS